MLDNLILKSGVGKNNKKWFALQIIDEFESGKKFTSIQFISEKTFNKLADSQQFKIKLK